MSKRVPFRDMPNRRKLLVVGLLTTGFALSILAVLVFVQGVIEWRNKTADDLATYAAMIGTNAAPALVFDDRKAATDTLAALEATPDVVFGAIYDKKGLLFATFGAKASHAQRVKPEMQHGVLHFSVDHLDLSAPIFLKGERLGTIYLESDLRQLYRGLGTESMLIVVAAAAAFSLAAFLFLRLQRGIVDPILALSRAMKGVSRDRDYSVRVTPAGADEIGGLAQAFNSMLEAVQDRNAALAGHQTQLEETVARRTEELKRSNRSLERELGERKAAEDALREHDALLKAVTRSASELLSALNIDEAIPRVLELIGQTVAVSRVQLNAIAADQQGHLRSSVKYEWCALGMMRMIDNPALQDLDLTATLPKTVAPTLVGEQTSFFVGDMAQPYREVFEKAEMRSSLQLPVLIEGKLWGGLNFIDSSSAQRQWSWAENDTLRTLADLLGVSLARAQYIRELADANTIVQNSPTILYRLRGEPSFPMIYVSHNITKFGHDPALLVATPDWRAVLVHPDDRAKIQAAMARILEKNATASTIEFRMQTGEGGWRWVENRYTPVRDKAARLIEVEGIITDITERKVAEEKIALLARTDSLTGLANRATFTEHLGEAFAAAKRGASAFAVLYLDLDRFKDINDTLGHPTGDELLRAAAERLTHNVRETDLVARFGGDEFAILQTEMADPSAAGALASKVGKALATPFKISGNELRVTVSIGISPFVPGLAGPDAMLAQADLALYRAKDEGRDQYRFHSQDLDKEVRERVTLAEDLRKAVDQDEMELYFQPQVELSGGQIVGMEALIRWHHPTRGLLMPGDFIPIAEKTGSIQAIGQWVLEKACEQMKSWRDQGIAPPLVAVNLSLVQIKAGRELVREITETLAKWSLAPGDLELDVTESTLAQITWTQSDVLARIRELGVKVALDDFGTEYSSFDYVRTYRVNHIKIAQWFVDLATRDPERAATIRAIINLARELGLQVIAEGVETEEQRTLLASIGPETQAQGFYFSPPVPAAQAEVLLRQKRIRPAQAAEAPAGKGGTGANGPAKRGTARRGPR